MSEHDEDDEILSLLQADRSPAARALAKIFIRQKKHEVILVGDEDTGRRGLIKKVSNLQKGYTYLAIGVILSTALGAAASHSFLFAALKLALP